MRPSPIEFSCDKIYIIGDLHLAVGIEEKSMEKFYFYKNYMEKLEKSLSILTDDDVLIVCGDICWGKRLPDALPSLDFLDKFKGKKILFKGNHDYWFEKLPKLNDMYQNIFFLRNKEVIINNIPFIMQKGYYINSEDATEEDYKLLNRELLRIKDKIVSYKKMGYEGNDVVLTLHYPPVLKRDLDNYKNMATLNILNYALSENICKCYYGHLHSDFGLMERVDKKIEDTEFYCVSADLVDFKLQEIKYKDNRFNID